MGVGSSEVEIQNHHGENNRGRDDKHAGGEENPNQRDSIRICWNHLSNHRKEETDTEKNRNF